MPPPLLLLLLLLLAVLLPTTPTTTVTSHKLLPPSHDFETTTCCCNYHSTTTSPASVAAAPTSTNNNRKEAAPQLPPRPCHPEAVAESQYAREMMIIAGAPTLRRPQRSMSSPYQFSNVSGWSIYRFNLPLAFSRVGMFACPEDNISTYADKS